MLIIFFGKTKKYNNLGQFYKNATTQTRVLGLLSLYYGFLLSVYFGGVR